MIRLLNMSFAAGCTVLIVLVLRLFLKKLPKKYSYGLWLIVLFRFFCPVVIPSSLSLFPVNPEPVSQEIVYKAEPEIQTGVIWVDRAVNNTIGESLGGKDPSNSVNPIQIWLFGGFVLWLLGLVFFLGFHLWQFTRLKRNVAEAVLAQDVSGDRKALAAGSVRILESDQIDGAFVLGIICPVIYLPAGLEGTVREFILKHEKVHIGRGDYLVKMMGLLAVAVHWFNPLAWVGFRIMCGDMEMSCDEEVLRRVEGDQRKEYSRVLLEQTVGKSDLMLPLAFGKNHTYQRICNILAYHKPKAIFTLAAVGILTVAGIGLITSPKKNEGAMEEKDKTSVSIIGGADGPTSIFVAGKTEGGREEPIWQRERPDSAWLASVEIERPENENVLSSVYLDFASETALIFHGDFGLFSFEKTEEGKWKQQIFVKDVDTGQKLADALELVASNELQMNRDSVTKEEAFYLTDASGKSYEESKRGENFQITDYDVAKMTNGKIALVGTASSASENSGRLIDLYYGYYDPGEQILKQVFLFLGDGEEIQNPRGEVSEGRWLFEREGFDYYLRTPQKLLDMENTDGRNEGFRYHIPYGRMELARSRKGEDQLLDSLVYLDQTEQNGVTLTEDRIIYQGFEEASVLSVKHPVAVSIHLDGRDRRVSKALYGVTRGLCYADGYLYYEGWTNDSKFPVPLMRVRPDFRDEEQIGQLPGSLVCVRDGGACLFMDWEKKRIMVSSVDKLGESEAYWEYLGSEDVGRSEKCTMKNMGNGNLKITLEAVEEPFYREEYWLIPPIDMWEEDF